MSLGGILGGAVGGLADLAPLAIPGIGEMNLAAEVFVGGSPSMMGGSLASGIAGAVAGEVAGLIGGHSGAVNEKLAGDLLQAAKDSTDPKQKNDLIQAALNALGGHGGATAAAPLSAPPPAPVALAAAAPSDPASSGPMTVNGNTVDTGKYTITASTDKGGDLVIKDKQTGKTIEAYGDPHLTTSDGDKADFQKDGLSINLPDGTRVEMKPTQVDGNGKAYLGGALITKGDQAVEMNGFHDGGLKTSQPEANTEALDQSYMTQGETVLDTDQQDIGKLDFTNADGSISGALDSKKDELHLDGKGGGEPPAGTAATAVVGVAVGSSVNSAALDQLSKVSTAIQQSSMDPVFKNQLENDVAALVQGYMGQNSNLAAELAV